MLTRKRFDNIKKGEILLFKVGKKSRPRLVLQDVRNNCVKLLKVNSTHFLSSTTVYNYSDIYKKVIAVIKVKADAEKLIE